jgi:hypothetical protein
MKTATTPFTVPDLIRQGYQPEQARRFVAMMLARSQTGGESTSAQSAASDADTATTANATATASVPSNATKSRQSNGQSGKGSKGKRAKTADPPQPETDDVPAAVFVPPARPASEPTPTMIRNWAKSEGIKVSERGRIPADIRARFDARGS